MGIFTGNVTSSSVDLYAPAEHEITTEGVNINFYEASVMAIAESEVFYNRAMKEIGIAEACYLAENGREMIYEAVDIKAVGEKLKNFFKKLIDKVKAILHAFVAKISSWGSDDKKFVQKYEKEFSRKWNDVKDDFEFKGYKFSINLSTSKTSFTDGDSGYTRLNAFGNALTGLDQTIKDSLDKVISADPNTNIVDTIKSVAKADGEGYTKNIKKVIEATRDDKDTIQGKLRADVYKRFATAYGKGGKYDNSNEMDEKDFTTSMFELFRSGESEKEGIEKKDISIAEIITQLRNSKTYTTAAEKSCSAVIKDIEKGIKFIDNTVTAIGKVTPEKGEESSVDFRSACMGLLSVLNEVAVRPGKEYMVKAQGILLQAMADQSRQNKAIMVKVIAGGKKMKNESYDYTNESYSGSESFLDSIVIK